MSATSKAKIASAEHRNGFSNNWVVPLTGTCSHKPGFFCYAMFCCYCASYTNRKEFLRGDMTRYVCCNGHWPCSGKMKEQSCPEFCLATETQVKIEMKENSRWVSAAPAQPPYAAPPQQQMAYIGQAPAPGYPAHAPAQQHMGAPEGYPAA